jgi:hypothetical protein
MKRFVEGEDRRQATLPKLHIDGYLDRIDPRYLASLRPPLPRPRSAVGGPGRGGQQQVQGGERPREEPHAEGHPTPLGAVRGERRALPRCAGDGGPSGRGGDTERLKDGLARLKQRMAHLRETEAAVRAAPDGQVSLADPDACAMATTGKNTGLVGYNVQAAVGTKHHLIVAHEATNIGNDRAQLSTMAGRRAGGWRRHRAGYVPGRRCSHRPGRRGPRVPGPP